ncbi:MAG: hypothetical protein ACKVOR_02820 [Flavobacteriales bacterium]
MYFLTHHISRYLFALPFLAFGVVHLISGSTLAAFLPEVLPGSSLMYVYATGTMLILAALSISFKYYDYYASLGLAALLLLFVLCIHAPSVSSTNPMAVSNVLKDSALCGAALLYAGTRMK